MAGQIRHKSRDAEPPIKERPSPDEGPYYVDGHPGEFDGYDAAKDASDNVIYQQQVAFSKSQGKGQGWGG